MLNNVPAVHTEMAARADVPPQTHTRVHAHSRKTHVPFHTHKQTRARRRFSALCTVEVESLPGKAPAGPDLASHRPPTAVLLSVLLQER